MDGVEALLAERDIQKVLLRFCRGVDRADAELIRSCYHPGASDSHGRFQGSGEAFAEYIVPIIRSRFESTMHAVHNSLVEFDGDALAHVETYFVAYHVSKVEPPSDAEFFTFAGRYVDRFEKRDGEWRISDRVVVRDWSLRRPIAADELEREHAHAAPFMAARQDHEDLGYPEAFAKWSTARPTTPLPRRMS